MTRLTLAAIVSLPVLCILLWPGTAFAGEADPSTRLANGGTAAAMLFLLAAVLESALATLFNWRPFVEVFNARATRPLVAFVVSLVVVALAGYDGLAEIMKAVSGDAQAPALGWTGKIITAAIISGGSAGVNTLLVTLGYRERKTPGTAPKPQPTDAWISVTLRGGAGFGEVPVYIGTPDAASNLPPLARVLHPSRSERGPIAGFFLRDLNRVPPELGKAVVAGQPCMVKVVAMPPSANCPGVSRAWSFIPAPGAIIDLVAELGA